MEVLIEYIKDWLTKAIIAIIYSPSALPVEGRRGEGGAYPTWSFTLALCQTPLGQTCECKMLIFWFGCVHLSTLYRSKSDTRCKVEKNQALQFWKEAMSPWCHRCGTGIYSWKDWGLYCSDPVVLVCRSRIEVLSRGKGSSDWRAQGNLVLTQRQKSLCPPSCYPMFPGHLLPFLFPLPGISAWGTEVSRVK